MLNKKFIFSVLLVVFLSSCQSVANNNGNVIVKGTVYYGGMRQAVSGAVVVLAKPDGLEEYKTNEKGEYLFTTLKDGEAYSLYAKHETLGKSPTLIFTAAKENSFALQLTEEPPTVQDKPESMAAITGVVYDINRKPVMANIHLISTRDDKVERYQDGSFEFNDIKPGIHTLTVEAEGYNSLIKRNLSVADNETLDLVIYLAPLKKPPQEKYPAAPDGFSIDSVAFAYECLPNIDSYNGYIQGQNDAETAIISKNNIIIDKSGAVQLFLYLKKAEDVVQKKQEGCAYRFLYISWLPYKNAEGYYVYYYNPFKKRLERMANVFNSELDYGTFGPPYLEVGKEYSFAVSAYFSNGKETKLTPLKSITISDAIQEMVPAINEKDVSVTPTFSWMPVENAEKYEIIVADASEILYNYLKKPELASNAMWHAEIKPDKTSVKYGKGDVNLNHGKVLPLEKGKKYYWGIYSVVYYSGTDKDGNRDYFLSSDTTGVFIP